MPGKLKPALLNQVLEELNIMERQPRPAFGKAKRDCIRELVAREIARHESIDKQMVAVGDWLRQPAEEGETMNRLTERVNGVAVIRKANLDLHFEVDGKIGGDIADRLAAYEDTGLEPEEVAALAKAQQDGRLVVLPCKEGDKIFEITKGLSIYQSGLNAYVSERAATKLEIFNWIRRREFGTTVFPTREEAEAALNPPKPPQMM